MKILINIGHPAHVHLFKNMIWKLEKNGHECKIATVDKEITLHLLNAFSFDYDLLTNMGGSLFSKATSQLKAECKFYKIARSFNPDVLVSGPGGLCASHIGKLINKPSIIFDDTEHSKIEHFLMDPFATVVCTPSCYKLNLGRKQVLYNGYHELAYLHPNYFTPNPEVLRELGLNENDIYVVVRFVSWSAGHDIGQHGIENKKALIDLIEKYGKVFITSEAKLDAELERYKLKVSPEKLHDLLCYATLYIGEGATTASECAVLGTHAIYVNTLRLGYTDEQEEKYELVYNFSNKNDLEKKVFDKVSELLKNSDLKKEGKVKKENIIKDKIDVTDFMVRLVEQYK